MLITIAIPCYRSSKTLPFVVNEIKEEFSRQSKYEYEIVLVNDGSPDHGETYQTIKELCQEDSRIIGVDLSRNFGQQSAKLAALPYVKGDILVYMDDDGQHPASGILVLADKLQEGFDVVYGRFPQKKVSSFKKVTSRIHGKLAEWKGTCPKGITISPFVAWSRMCVEAVKNYHSPFPSSGGYLSKITTKYANVDIEQRTRKEGKSGYNFKKLFSAWIMSFTNFSIMPLRIIDVFGMFSSVIGMLMSIFLIIRKLINPHIVAGYTSIMAVMLLVGGIMMLALGLTGEYIGRMYMILSNMPQYMVRETCGQNTHSESEQHQDCIKAQSVPLSNR